MLVLLVTEIHRVMHLVRDAVHMQRLVAHSPILSRLVSATWLRRYHAETHSRLDLEFHRGLMPLVQLIAEVLAVGLLTDPFHVCNLLLLQDALENAIARGFVHV